MGKQEVQNKQFPKPWNNRASGCLDSHPSFLCNVGAAIFSLQVQNIWQTFLWSRHFWSTILPCLGKVRQKLSFMYCLSTLDSCQQLRQRQFLAQTFCHKESNLHMEVLWCSSSCYEVDARNCLTVMKSPMLLKHLNAIFCYLWSVWRPSVYLKYMFDLENILYMTTSLIVTDDY